MGSTKEQIFKYIDTYPTNAKGIFDYFYINFEAGVEAVTIATMHNCHERGVSRITRFRMVEWRWRLECLVQIELGWTRNITPALEDGLGAY